MMKLHRQTSSAGKQLSQQQIIWIVVVFVFLLINIIMLLVVTLPQRRELTNAELLYANKKEELMQLEQTHTLEQLPLDDIEKLKLRTPFERKDSNTLLDFLGIAEQSNIYVTYVNQVGTDQPSDQVQANASEQAPASTALEPVFKLKLLGNRDEVLSFINNLHHHDRLYRTMKWVVAHVEKDQAESDYPNLKEKEGIDVNLPLYEIDLEIRTYILSQYADLFK